MPNIEDPDFRPREGAPPGFRAFRARVGYELGSERLGASVWKLPPGEAAYPYHFHYSDEELLFVLSGRPTLRTPAGEEQLGPWDVVCFPRGPEGAHGVRNETDETARVLMFSTVVLPTATVYPDSDKVGIWTGDEATDVVVRRSSRVEYYDGET